MPQKGIYPTARRFLEAPLSDPVNTFRLGEYGGPG